jgi:hypothetical protein
MGDVTALLFLAGAVLFGPSRFRTRAAQMREISQIPTQAGTYDAARFRLVRPNISISALAASSADY